MVRRLIHIAACLCGAAALAAPGQGVGKTLPVERPVTRFTRQTVQMLINIMERMGNLDADALYEVYVRETRNRCLPRWTYRYGPRNLVVLFDETGDKKYHAAAVRAYRAALRDHIDDSDEQLRAKVSDRGGLDMLNYRMRDASEHFAMLYYLTRQTEYAHRSAVLLARFAEQIPKWLVYSPRCDRGNVMPRKVTKTFAQDDPELLKLSSAPGFWGTWMPEDILQGVPLARAYDLIYDSGEMERLGALESIEEVLRRHVEIQRRWGTNWFSNLDALQIRGIIHFARILNEPEWVHECVRWIKNIYGRCFYADGWWHEGTPSYHHQSHSWLRSVAVDLLQGYSDPPGFKSERDGTRFDNLDILKMLDRQFARADDALRNVVQPNGIYQVIHDTIFPHRAPGPPVEKARSVLFGCVGHAILGTGEGKGNLTQASLHFGGAHGHAHRDCLNLVLFAKGKELISETRYRPGKATNSTREWHTSTAGHVTVVVDGKDQVAWYHSIRRKQQPEDAIPGVRDWKSRWSNHGSVMIDGKLRLFNHDFSQVQVAEADGERSYGSLVKMAVYRRTIALVKISETDCYVVDVFRVRGGTTHDYLLHSCLDFPHKLTTSIAPKEKLPGPLHKYLTDVRVGRTDDSWSATFALDDGSASLKSFFLPQKGTEIVRGTGPAMRRLGVAPFLAVRQTDGESIFVAIHHPYVREPLVQRVDPLPLGPDDGLAVAIRVTLRDRVDTIVSTMDEEPWTLRQTPDGEIRLRGRFTHIAEGSGGEWLYLAQGDLLAAGEKTIRGSVTHKGLLTGTRRVEAGDPFDAFITDAKLPTDGSLNGRTLMVDEGGLLVQSFRIKSVEVREGQTLIHSHDEPGMTITPNLVKLEYFPCWGIRGQARFRIAGSGLLRATGRAKWRFTASSRASATVGRDSVPRH